MSIENTKSYALIEFSQIQRTNQVLVDADDTEFYALGNPASAGTAANRVALLQDCLVTRLGINVLSNTRGITTTFTTVIATTDSGPLVTVLTLATGFAFNDTIGVAAVGDLLRARIDLGVDTPNAITIIGFGWRFQPI